MTPSLPQRGRQPKGASPPVSNFLRLAYNKVPREVGKTYHRVAIGQWLPHILVPVSRSEMPNLFRDEAREELRSNSSQSRQTFCASGIASGVWRTNNILRPIIPILFHTPSHAPSQDPHRKTHRQLRCIPCRYARSHRWRRRHIWWGGRRCHIRNPVP